MCTSDSGKSVICNHLNKRNEKMNKLKLWKYIQIWNKIADFLVSECQAWWIWIRRRVTPRLIRLQSVCKVHSPLAFFVSLVKNNAFPSVYRPLNPRYNETVVYFVNAPTETITSWTCSEYCSWGNLNEVWLSMRWNRKDHTSGILTKFSSCCSHSFSCIYIHWIATCLISFIW